MSQSQTVSKNVRKGEEAGPVLQISTQHAAYLWRTEGCEYTGRSVWFTLSISISLRNTHTHTHSKPRHYGFLKNLNYYNNIRKTDQHVSTFIQGPITWGG